MDIQQPITPLKIMFFNEIWWSFK